MESGRINLVEEASPPDGNGLMYYEIASDAGLIGLPPASALKASQSLPVTNLHFASLTLSSLSLF